MIKCNSVKPIRPNRVSIELRARDRVSLRLYDLNLAVFLPFRLFKSSTLIELQKK